MEIPFDEKHQLCDKLQIENGQIQRKQAEQNGQAAAQKTYLPGDPRIQLTDTNIGQCLQAELMTVELNKLAPYLWLMTTQSSKNISPLTEQLVRGRKLIVSENPGLHLVWVHDRVFLKPLPEYLLSHIFWEHYLVSADSPIEESARRDLLKAARGFVRSYAYLIQHKSDFALAKQDETLLIPKNISYADFVAFIDRCTVDNALVSPRYHFGELRLTRLNFWCRIFLFKSVYQKVEWQYGAYFAQYYAPVLFVFAVFSLLTSAMQVVLAAQAILESDDSSLTFARVSRGFSLFTILFVACVIAALLIALINLVSREAIFALQDLFRPKGQQINPDQENQVGRNH